MNETISRRDFLSVTAAAALVGSLAAAVPARAELGSDRKIRMGIVGGGFGASFQWHLDPNCTVEAVSDLRPDRRAHLQKVYRCEKAYESLEKLVLDPKIEAVAVFTPAPDHARHVLEVLKHGKHCICAVPACLTLEEARALQEAKARTGLTYMMAETTCYRWPTILARQLWADGKFGKFLYSEVEYYHNGIGAAANGLSNRGGKHTWRYGYPPMLYPTHSTAFHVGVNRERLTHVSCLGWADGDPARTDNPYGCPDANQAALFRTSGGNICRCNVFWRVKADGERAQWLGDKLAVYMGASSGQRFVARSDDKTVPRSVPNYFHLLPEPMRVGTGHGNSHTFLTHEFIAALVEERAPVVDVHEALAMTVPGIVAMQSAARNGEQLKVPSFDPAQE
ncbi:Gfo/Idh/MocA family oxidoreductase [bacterium]|nr:Gfo/Idh/MocA family oxidoreductase [bacterium]